jgi:undecaprenyl-diphosphatase
MLATTGQPQIVDFSFSELAATGRQMSLDVAELLASTAALVGPEKAVACAVFGVGGEEVTRAVPLLQPLALSASTRRSVRGQEGLLTKTRVAAAGVMGAPANELARLQRVRLRTVVMVGLAVGAFYFLLPQLAQARSSWKAFQSANWVWLPLVIAMSALTYVAGNLSIMGTVSRRLPFGPTLLIQSASSFVNRVSPANVGGMALNVRYLQKSGVDSPTAVSAVGLNSFVGGIMHIVLIAIFFAWSGTALTKAFKLPSGSKLLLILALLAAALGVVLTTGWGRRHLWSRLVRAIRRSLANLREVATSPAKLTLLFGGSILVTLAYVAALAASVEAFGGGVSVAQIGAVYLAASALAAAAPTPGGLGAIEAALVAGLSGVGMRPAAAVSAVLTYRLATYWLPVLPGWLSWHFLQRRQYI